MARGVLSPAVGSSLPDFALDSARPVPPGRDGENVGFTGFFLRGSRTSRGGPGQKERGLRVIMTEG
jgi:hypothetical protein